MPRKKNLTVNFFRAVTDGEKRNESVVHDLLTSTAQMKWEERACGSSSDYLTLGEYKMLAPQRNRPNLWVGQLRRIRPNDRVAEGSLDGYFADAPFTKGHATETGHFLTIPDYKALLYAGSPMECGWTQLRYYLTHFMGEDGSPIEFYPILNKNKVDQLDRMKFPRKFSLKVATPDNWTLGDPSLAKTTQPAIEYGADWISIEMGMDRRPGRSLHDSIKTLAVKAAAFVMSSEERYKNASMIRLEGRTKPESGAEKVHIDFIEDRLKYQEAIDVTTITTVAKWTSAVYGALQKAYNECGAAVRRDFRPSDTPAK